MFPKIRYLNEDVLPHIQGKDEFIVAERDHYNAVNYMVSMPDTFLDPKEENISWEEQRTRLVRRECRGMIFSKDGQLIARRLHKFFNVNEKDESRFDKIDWSRPHVILEKLDGSMITPIPMYGETAREDHLRWGTKMGITEISMNAEEFIEAHPEMEYNDFAWLYINRNATPIFEWCSRKNRIVIDYPEDRLVLIAIRDNYTGEYRSYDQMKTYTECYGIECVKQYEGTADNMEKLMAETKDASGIEGWVIRFDDGDMYKIKGEEYVRIHRTKDDLNSEKNLLSLIVNEEIDDAKAFMLEEDRRRVERFEEEFWEEFDKTALIIGCVLDEAEKMDRKTWAVEKSKSYDQFTRSIVFSCFGDDTKCVTGELLKILKKNLGSSTRIEHVRHLFGDLRWNYQSYDEAA